MRSEAGSGDDALAVRVQIIGRVGCHLCDEAEAVVVDEVADGTAMDFSAMRSRMSKTKRAQQNQ